MNWTLPDYEYESRRYSMCRPLQEGQWNTLLDIEGPGIIKHIWMTYPLADKGFGRNNWLRIFWDDETEPSVYAPLADFFGVPFGHTGQQYDINSCFLSVLPQNGFNSYFTMPFSQKAKIELFVKQQEMGYGFYFQADVEHCSELPARWGAYRFHAHYRMEGPTEQYGERYLALDAEGDGYYIGATFGIRRTERKADAWYHGGGDLMMIDGETSPQLIHGIGAEDYFGHSWGTAKSSHLYNGNPFIQELDIDDRRPLTNLALYRFHAQDPVRFRHSFRFSIGAMGDPISSVAYWYQTEPHRPFFAPRPDHNLLQDAEVPRETYDIALPDQHCWKVLGPIADEEPYTFDRIHAVETGDQPHLPLTFSPKGLDEDYAMKVDWTSLIAPRGFADLNTVMRPQFRGIRYATECYAFASGCIYSEVEREIVIRLAFDDRLSLKINGNQVFDGNHDSGFQIVRTKAVLREGYNHLLVKLSNTHNTNFKAWVFNVGFEDENGTPIKYVVYPWEMKEDKDGSKPDAL